MMVLIVEKVRPGLRGRLTRWLIQVKTGVYVGHLSGRIRDRLWELVCEEIDLHRGSAVLIAPAANEQGYRIESHGGTSRRFVDFEGLTLPKTPKSAP